MRLGLIAVVASLLAAGAAVAQIHPDNKGKPSYEPKATGPQDSVGTVGESPTKQMLKKSDNEKESKDTDRSVSGSSDASPGNASGSGPQDSGSAGAADRSTKENPDADRRR